MPFYILITLSLYLFSGCTTTTPTIAQYTLTPSYTKSDQKNVQSTKTIRIVTTETLSSLNNKNIRYTLKNLESGTYLYGRWSDTPSMMLNRMLVSSLESEKLFPVVITANSDARYDLVLESEILAFDHRFVEKQPSQGFIDLFCRLVDTKTKQPIATQRFTIAVNAKSEDIQGGVIALQKASEELIQRQISWLMSIQK